MNHLKSTKKLKRTTEERKKLVRDLSQALIRHGKITTFTGRAKWFRPKFERLITLAKKSEDDKILALRKLQPFITEKDAHKLIDEIVPKYKDRSGGYLSILKVQQDFSEHDKSIVMFI
jgi:large subunit ribosomal protein L17